MTEKYYAVKIGRKPGIYRTWDECKKEVEGFKGAIYKSFKTKKDAEFYIIGEAEAGSEDEDTSNSLHAYVDGSYIEGIEFGSGCVLIFKNEIIKELSIKFIDEELATMRNVAGEIKAAESAIKFALEYHYESLIIYHDYEGIARWPKGEWKANKVGTKAYKEFYDDVKDKVRIEFVKVKGHSGNHFNDIADNLAKNALGLT